MWIDLDRAIEAAFLLPTTKLNLTAALSSQTFLTTNQQIIRPLANHSFVQRVSKRDRARKSSEAA